MDELGDEPTAYFFRCAKIRKAKNEISCLKLQKSLEWTSDSEAITQEFLSFYSDLFKCNEAVPDMTIKEDWVNEIPKLIEDHILRLLNPSQQKR